jgi:polysaccharide biosynthesis/export protein
MRRLGVGRNDNGLEMGIIEMNKHRSVRQGWPLALAIGFMLTSGGACTWQPFYNPPAYPTPPARVVGDVEDYVIGVPDLLQLTVWQHPDFTGPVLVRRDGKISVPLMGDIQAEGLTPEKLAEKIRIALSKYISNPRVDVAVTEMRSQVASVIGGGVLRSGIIQLQHNTRVIDAIAEMGGLSPFAKKTKIRILRDTPGGQVEYPFDYTAFIRGRNPASNILLEPGDTVIVPE